MRLQKSSRWIMPSLSVSNIATKRLHWSALIEAALAMLKRWITGTKSSSESLPLSLVSNLLKCVLHSSWNFCPMICSRICSGKNGRTMDKFSRVLCKARSKVSTLLRPKVLPPTLLVLRLPGASFSAARETSLLRHALASMSSSWSKTDPCLPSSTATCGSTDHALTIDSDMPAASIRLPKTSSGIAMPSQLLRSAKPSKGDAEACTPLSLTSGTILSPS
mmetsp:Transcript_56799/g.183999  ORF Transcript_56799/g.183999 Transcript_56799/m.183999 type:complete len:220 (+) Transcript_56799:2570-3229(+)